MAVSWYALVALAATALGASIAPEEYALEKSSCGRVWITVHSPDIRTAYGTMRDALELNWDFQGCKIPKKIGLFNARPQSFAKTLAMYELDGESGYVITPISLGELPLPAGWNDGPGTKGPQCFWPWIGAGDETMVAYNCLKIQPTWMEDHMREIRELPIGELVIPGTHNAGAWRFNTELSTSARDSFVLCQDRSIWAQLVHGIRYFDFRVAYYDFYEHEDDRYWLNHNLVRVRPLLPLLREIRTFLDHTKEVVFLDAHHFPFGFYHPDGAPIRSVHEGLLALVQRELGPYLANAEDFTSDLPPGNKGPPLETFIETDKRLVFSYVDNAIVGEHNWLWPNLPHLWANTNSPNQLFAYLDQAITLHPHPNSRSVLHSAMAQTTPTVLDILFLRGSLRQNADAVNRNVTDRLAYRWRRYANIVSTDFFLANDVVDLSVTISVERGTKFSKL